MSGPCYQGFVELGSSLVMRELTTNSSRVPTNADALPTYRVYGPAGIMTNGTGSLALANTGSVTGATNATPIVITSASHGLSTGTRVTVASVGGNTAANGTWLVTRVDANTFSLDDSVGNGSYTSGGTWNVTGLYQFTVDATSQNGYAAGYTYTVLVRYAVTSQYGDLFTFTVV
jgi:hypothetical protein